MKNVRGPMVCLVAPLVVTVILVFAAKSFYGRAARLEAENRSCRASLASLEPYLKSLSEYRAAEKYLERQNADAGTPAMPMGVPAPERVSSRGTAGSDGWIPVREEYSWNDILPGQAFAVLSKFTSPEVSRWRIAELEMSCVGGDGKVSLSVALESAE